MSVTSDSMSVGSEGLPTAAMGASSKAPGSLGERRASVESIDYMNLDEVGGADTAFFKTATFKKAMKVTAFIAIVLIVAACAIFIPGFLPAALVTGSFKLIGALAIGTVGLTHIFSTAIICRVQHNKMKAVRHNIKDYFADAISIDQFNAALKFVYKERAYFEPSFEDASSILHHYLEKLIFADEENLNIDRFMEIIELMERSGASQDRIARVIKEETIALPSNRQDIAGMLNTTLMRRVDWDVISGVDLVVALDGIIEKGRRVKEHLANINLSSEHAPERLYGLVWVLDRMATNRISFDAQLIQTMLVKFLRGSPDFTQGCQKVVNLAKKLPFDSRVRLALEEQLESIRTRVDQSYW